MPIRSNRGATLVETMVAVLVFGIVLVGLLYVCAQSISMGKRSELSYVAYNLAKNHLETLKSMPYSSLSSASETDTLLDETGVPDTDGTFKRSTAIVSSYSGNADLTHVTVTVDYKVKGTFMNNPISLTEVIFQYA